MFSRILKISAESPWIEEQIEAYLALVGAMEDPQKKGLALCHLALQLSFFNPLRALDIMEKAMAYVNHYPALLEHLKIFEQRWAV